MINLIVAVADNNLIGDGDKLPWSNSEDLKEFKRLTSNNVVIMGKNTFKSIGKPLPNRINIVISRYYFKTDGVIYASSLEEAINKAKEYDKEIFIIGGAIVYSQSFDIVDRMYISHIPGNFKGDKFFPKFDNEEWEIDQTIKFNTFEQKIYRRS